MQVTMTGTVYSYVSVKSQGNNCENALGGDYRTLGVY